MEKEFKFFKSVLKGEEYNIDKKFIINWRDLKGIFEAKKILVSINSFGGVSLTFYGNIGEKDAIYTFQ